MGNGDGLYRLHKHTSSVGRFSSGPFTIFFLKLSGESITVKGERENMRNHFLADRHVAFQCQLPAAGGDSASSLWTSGRDSGGGKGLQMRVFASKRTALGHFSRLPTLPIVIRLLPPPLLPIFCFCYPPSQRKRAPSNLKHTCAVDDARYSDSLTRVRRR